MKNFKIFIPGRLCVFGEHSDWAATYGNAHGYAIVSSIDRGIYAEISLDEKIVFIHDDKEVVFDYDSLVDNINNKTYYSYISSTIKYMIDNYDVKGIKIKVTKSTLPEKKGLSSSAAICVLVVKAYNEIYDLNLSVDEEMKIAFISEQNVGSKCGKLDQVVALGENSFFMTFTKENVEFKKIFLKKDLYFVFADLDSNKDTIKILNDLNDSYLSDDLISKNVRLYLEDINKKIVNEAYKYFISGNCVKIGKLMNRSQKLFDKYVAPKCLAELESPKLHMLLNDKEVKNLSLGGKGVGSQGDGTVQFIVESEEKQKELINLIKRKFRLKAYDLTLKSQGLKKAVIPMAGSGSRMMPFTRSIPKSFIPIVKDGMLKPIFYVLLEELYDAGVEKIALVIDKNQRKFYDDFFADKKDEKFSKIYDSISFIYQEKPLGLAHALYCCKDFVGNDNFIFVLGDQFYASNSKISCTQQLVNFYNQNPTNIISVCSVNLNLVNKYGIFYGNKVLKNKFVISKICEKPSIEFARKNLFVKRGNKEKYFAAFGEYVFGSDIFARLNEIIVNNKKTNGEFQLTDIFSEMAKDGEMYAFIPNGKMYDVGNVDSYIETMKKYYK